MRDAIAILGMMVFFGAGGWLIASWLKTRKKPRLRRYLIAAPIGVLASAIFGVTMLSLGLIDNGNLAKSDSGSVKHVVLDDKEIESLFSITEEIYLPDRRTVEVQLQRRVGKKTLGRIAEKVKETGKQNVNQTFIGYRLNNQKPNSTYWATTHYSPDLTVRIAGLTPHEVESLRSFNVEDHYDQAIGSWIVERGFNHLAVAYLDDNQVFIDHVFPDGNVVTKEYRTSQLDDGGLRLQAVDDTFGDYFTVGEKGKLRYWSENENYLTAAPVNPDAVNLEFDDVEFTSSLPPRRAEIAIAGSEILAEEVTFNGRGHAACETEESLDELLRAAIDSDQRGINRLLDRDCIIPPSGIPVTVLDRAWGGKIHVRTLGQDGKKEYWTVADALSARDS